MTEKLYREVSVSDRLPKTETIVQTIHHDTYVDIIHAMVLDKKGNWFFYPSDVHGCEPTSYLEEISIDDPAVRILRLQIELEQEKNKCHHLFDCWKVSVAKKNEFIDLLMHYKNNVDAHTQSQKEFSQMVNEILKDYE